MTKIWVGTLLAITFILSSIGTAVSAPHEQRQSDNFERPDATRWELVRGALSFESEHGWAGDALTWMVVADDNDSVGQGPSRVRVNASHMTDGVPTWNTTSGSYYYSATLDHHHSYVAPASTYSPTATPATGPASNTTGGGTPPAGGGATTSSGTIPLSISADATSGFAPFTVTFTLTSAHANASDLVWTFDQNSNGIINQNGTGLPATFSVTYTGTGTRIAKLNATYGNESGEATLSILISAAPALETTLAASGTSGPAPLLVDFDLSSADPASSGWTWSFDADGDSVADATGTGLPAAVSHTYSAAGIYLATLSVSDGSQTGLATLTISATTATTGSGMIPGAIGITFGEDPAGGGYYVAAFRDDGFWLGVPNGTADTFDIIASEPDWGNVDPRKQNIDVRHKYAVEVDGSTVSVYVDNGLVGSYVLPGVARGLFGVITDEDMRVNVGEVRWQILDKIKPTVEIFRPEESSIYVQDQGIGIGAVDAIIVQGDLTIAADIQDDVGGVGLRYAQALIDGRPVDMSNTPGPDTIFEVPTGSLSTGYHVISVRAIDHQGNSGTDEVRVFVIGSTIPSRGTAEELVGDLLPPL